MKVYSSFTFSYVSIQSTDMMKASSRKQDQQEESSQVSNLEDVHQLVKNMSIEVKTLGLSITELQQGHNKINNRFTELQEGHDKINNCSYLHGNFLQGLDTLLSDLRKESKNKIHEVECEMYQHTINIGSDVKDLVLEVNALESKVGLSEDAVLYQEENADEHDKRISDLNARTSRLESDLNARISSLEERLSVLERRG